MAEAARVIKLVGGGADALRQAIESGVMSVEARHMAERVLAENGALRRRNAALELENRDLKLLNARYRDLEMRTIDQAVRAQDDLRQRVQRGGAGGDDAHRRVADRLLMRREFCDRCRRAWNVSAQRDCRDGYICPECEQKMKRRMKNGTEKKAAEQRRAAGRDDAGHAYEEL